MRNSSEYCVYQESKITYNIRHYQKRTTLILKTAINEIFPLPSYHVLSVETDRLGLRIPALDYPP